MATATNSTKSTSTNNFIEAAFDQARQPFLVALGLSDLATQTTVNAVNKALAPLDRSGTEAQENADVSAWRKRLADSEFGKLFDPNELRRFFDPEELRELADAYVKAANELYQYLADQGETALDKLREQPGVGSVLGSVDDFYSGAQARVDDAFSAAEEMLGGLTRSTRSAGEKAARAAERAGTEASERTEQAGEKVSEATEQAGEKVSEATEQAGEKVSEATEQTGEKVSEAIAEAGQEAAHQARSTSRKAANKTDPNRSTNGGASSSSTRKS